MYTLLYRQQHAMIRRQVKELTDGMYGEKGASELRISLSRLASTVAIHFTTAQSSLYPRLTAHADASMRATAVRYRDTLDSISRGFTSFFETWKVYGAIERDRERFASETRDVLEALIQRIDAEDNDLYPRVDALPAA
ncbi:MAG TPA: hemerythrin domain-containing protein [Candidatus Sulfotelmatobacter sp.]|nr:hemerythrin domain-containing protein [Candidatus Sulfotelmatobacter sp.]